MRRPRSAAALALALLALAGLAVPATVLAHPLGNFTINTFAGLRISMDDIRLDVVVDYAEIPTFEARLELDADADGSVTASELEAAREPRCGALATDLRLHVDAAPAGLELAGSGLRLLSGAAAGAQTMRLVCEYVAAWPVGWPSESGAVVAFRNGIQEQRIGWREVVVEADGVAVTSLGDPVATASVSARLTDYPDDRLAVPLDVAAAEVRVLPGGPRLVQPSGLDASALAEVTWRPGFGPPSAPEAPGPEVPGPDAGPGAVPGGVAGEIPAIFRTTDLSPLLALVAVASAVGLGAAHALTPGHGKTLMAAYLVGTRGTARHAAGLGLSVSVSHTLGILALALLLTGAQSVLPADVVVRALPTVAAITIVGVGGWMLLAELRRRSAAAAHRRAHEHHDDPPGTHRHGGVAHSHGPVDAPTITWRSLFTLGLAGGLIPSTSALLILLGTIATGRTAFGIVLVVAFGLGMAAVMGGIGLLLVRARARLERMPRRSSLGRLSSELPLVAAGLVLGIGLWLTVQGVTGRPVL